MVVVCDVVENILTRLDVKDLLCCKSVCKAWYSVISSPHFVKAHLKHNDGGHTRIAMPSIWKIPNHQNLYQENLIWTVIGSSNGLVCVSTTSLVEDDALLLLVNPWTREVRELPLPVFPKEMVYGFDTPMGFGYDSSADDYKLVMIRKVADDESLVEVFSMKSMTWKAIPHIKCLLRGGLLRRGILFNGALHWFAQDCNSDNRPLVILSFNLSKEEFKLIPTPEGSRGTYYLSVTTLGVFEDSLCISCAKGFQSYHAVWVMRNYNANQSWEFLPNDYEMNSHHVIHYLRIYDCTSPNKNRMTFFCDDKAVSRSGKHVNWAPLFVQSLVSPFMNNERPSNAGNDKVAKLECQEMRIFDSLSKPSEKVLRKLGKRYKREGGETEKF